MQANKTQPFNMTAAKNMEVWLQIERTSTKYSNCARFSCVSQYARVLAPSSLCAARRKPQIQKQDKQVLSFVLRSPKSVNNLFLCNFIYSVDSIMGDQETSSSESMSATNSASPERPPEKAPTPEPPPQQQQQQQRDEEERQEDRQDVLQEQQQQQPMQQPKKLDVIFLRSEQVRSSFAFYGLGGRRH